MLNVFPYNMHYDYSYVFYNHMFYYHNYVVVL